MNDKCIRPWGAMVRMLDLEAIEPGSNFASDEFFLSFDLFFVFNCAIMFGLFSIRCTYVGTFKLD